MNSKAQNKSGKQPIKEKSITKNSIYYSIYQALNVIFPFLTGMYVARVLLPDSIGKVSYAQNIAQYFVILSYLGIPTYGLREIAKYRNDYKERSKVYSELLVINFISTCIFCTAYIILIFSVPSFRSNILLYLTTGGAIAINVFNNTWLFEGLEEFGFISIRNIVFKGLSFLALVIFVREPGDYIIYALITVLGTAGNYIINFIYSPRFVKLTIHGLNLRRHMNSILVLVVVNLAIELYSLVDVTMLGAMTSDKNVAYYSYASKINSIFIQIINAITMVIVPRIAFLYKENKTDEFNDLLSKTLETIFVLGLPLVLGMEICASDAIRLIYGYAFMPSANVLRILCLVLLISPIGYLLGSRVLLVTDHEKTMALCVGVGAMVNIIGNSILIPRFVEYGAAIASVISELVVMIVYVHFGKRYFHININKRNFVKVISSTILMGVFCLIVQYFTSDNNNLDIFLRLLGQVGGSCVIYFGVLYFVQEPMTVNFFNKSILKAIKRK